LTSQAYLHFFKSFYRLFSSDKKRLAQSGLVGMSKLVRNKNYNGESKEAYYQLHDEFY